MMRVFLGRAAATGEAVHLTSEELTMHVQVLGLVGTGKSKFLEHQARQMILDQRLGGLFLDPHGVSCEETIVWAATQGIKRPLLIINPTDPCFAPCFNVLGFAGADRSFQVDALVKALATVWGAASLDQTPLLKRILRLVFVALLENDLSLSEAVYLIEPSAGLVRSHLVRALEDPVARVQWATLSDLDPFAFQEVMSSTANRLHELLASPRVRRMVGAKRRSLNIRSAMDGGDVVLVNLAARDLISFDNARCLGTLILNACLVAARGRPSSSRLFRVIVDEGSRYVTDDLGSIAIECRKNQVSLTVAHQALAQLQEQNPLVAGALMGNLRTKVVFAVSADDAALMANEMFGAHFDLDEVKHQLFRTFFAPKKGYEEVVSTTHGSTTSSSDGTSASRAEGMAWRGINNQSTFSHEDAHGTSCASGSSETESETRSVVPITEHEERSELSSLTFRSLEEMRQRAAAALMNQPRQHFILARPGRVPVQVVAPRVVPGFRNGQAVRRYVLDQYRRSGVVVPIEQADEEIRERQAALEQAALAASQVACLAAPRAKRLGHPSLPLPASAPPVVIDLRPQDWTTETA